MRLSVASNYQVDLVEGLSDLPVEEVYGKLPRDCIGGGRASYMLKKTSRRQLVKHIRDLKEKNIRFNYLLNASCWDNREMTREGQKKLRKLLDWLVEIDVGAVTLSLPSLVPLIKRCYPSLKIRVSVFACVDRIQKARIWQDMGVDCICLDSLLVNREFSQLRALREVLSCDLQLLVNNSCMQSCPYAHAHMNSLCHASQSGHMSKGFLIDWCHLKCTSMRLADPVHYIGNEWIRPEDLHHYEDLGYDNFKIVERDMPTDVILARVKAYVNRRFDGNLLDLVQPYGHPKSAEDSKREKWHRLRYLFRPSRLPVTSLLKMKDLAEDRGFIGPAREAPVTIDNRSLDGFIDRFLEKGCREVDCDRCGYCARWADKVVKVNDDFRESCGRQYDSIFDGIDDGSFFKGV